MRTVAILALLCLGTVGCDSLTPPPPVNSIQAIDQSKMAAVEAILKEDQVLAGCVIKVSAQNDTVVLSGEVPTNDAKARAETMAKRVEGITKVANHLNVVPNSGSDPNEDTSIK